MKGKFILTVIIAVGIITAGAYFIFGSEDSGVNPFTENESREIAREFVKSSPTYKYDEENLRHVKTLFPDNSDHSNLYTFVFEFKSRHGGYGDRTEEQVIIPVITPHEAHVTVKNGEVIQAVLDFKWDMIEQRFIDEDENIRFESYVFDHAGVDQPIIKGGIAYQPENTDMRNFIRLISEEEQTHRFDYSLIDESARQFIENTDFENSVLVVIQEFPASSYPDYRVEEISLGTGGLYLFINNYSEMGTDDITVETVLMRVHSEGSPGEVVAITEEGRTFGSPSLPTGIDEVEAAGIGRTYLEGILSREGPGPWVGDWVGAYLGERVPNDYWYQLIAGDSDGDSGGGEVKCWILRFEKAKRPGHWFEVWIDPRTGDILGGVQCRS